MMLIYGLSEKEVSILRNWSVSVGLDEEVDNLCKLRWAWRSAGGQFPVTEAQALFLKPRAVAA